MFRRGGAMRKRWLLLSAISVLLASRGMSSAAMSDTPLRDNIGVADVSGGDGTNPRWDSDVGSNEFRRVMRSALGSAGLLERAKDEGRYSLSATLRSIDHSSLGCLTVTTMVTYTLTDKKSGKEVYQEAVPGEYTMDIWDSILRHKKLRVADESAARANAALLIEKLFHLSLSREGVSLAQ
jgi:hypothetical protein